MIEVNRLDLNDFGKIENRTSIGPVIHCQRKDTFCVPSAISAATGFSTGQVAQKILELRASKGRELKGSSREYLCQDRSGNFKYPLVGGVYEWETLHALQSLGVKFNTFYGHQISQMIFKEIGCKRASLANLQENMPETLSGSPLLVTLKGHMICVQDDMIVDNQIRTPVPRKIFGSG